MDLLELLTPLQKTAIGAVVALIAFDWYALSPLGSPPEKPQAQYEVGQDIDVAITLVTTDAKALACACPTAVEGKHCEFEAPKAKWKSSERPSQADILAPYKTTDDKLFLVPALWSEPALAQRLSIDPPTFGPEHARFVANCKMRLIGKVDKVDARWQLNGTFNAMGEAWVGTISACQLSDA